MEHDQTYGVLTLLTQEKISRGRVLVQNVLETNLRLSYLFYVSLEQT